MRGNIAVVASTLLIMLTTRSALSQDLPVRIDFESTPVGAPPDLFTLARTGPGSPGAWVVQDDPTAPSGKRVLVQTSSDSTNMRFPLCVYTPLTTADASISVRFKPLAGSVDQAAGLIWRYRDADNYYLVRANALESNVVLFKVERGKRSALAPVGSGLFTYGKKAEVSTGKWQQLTVTARGQRFAVLLNGTHLFDVEDSTFTAPGKVGLWTKADSVTAFDDLTVEPVGQP